MTRGMNKLLLRTQPGDLVFDISKPEDRRRLREFTRPRGRSQSHWRKIQKERGIERP